MIMQGIENFATIQTLVESYKSDRDNNKIRGLSGVSIAIDNNIFYLFQGKKHILCEIVSNVPTTLGSLDNPTVRLGPIDVIGRYIKEGPLDENPYFLVEQIIKYD